VIFILWKLRKNLMPHCTVRRSEFSMDALLFGAFRFKYAAVVETYGPNLSARTFARPQSAVLLRRRRMGPRKLNSKAATVFLRPASGPSRSLAGTPR
jgi:hypothetical protein